MKNADMPAVPVLDEIGMPYNSLPNEACTIGLTKREYFAAKAMAAYISGVIANSHPDYDPQRPGCDEVADEAIAYADAMLEKLEKSDV